MTVPFSSRVEFQRQQLPFVAVLAVGIALVARLQEAPEIGLLRKSMSLAPRYTAHRQIADALVKIATA